MFLLVAACPKQDRPLSPQELAGPVLRLTQALHAEAGKVADDKLLATTFQKKPELERDFREYTVQTVSSGTNVVVLVCTLDGKYALIEDASWTPYVDKKWYETEPQHAAQFTISPATGPPAR
jgi:hypothetical protein